MHIDWVALETFLLLATAVAVVYYAQTAREQLEATRELLETSQRQIEAAQRQLEASYMPCVVPVVESAAPEGPRLVLRNLGSGPALNVRYLATAQAGFAWPPGLSGGSACPPIPAGGAHGAAEGAGSLQSPHFFRVQFESLSGHRYQTEATVVDRAATADVRVKKL